MKTYSATVKRYMQSTPKAINNTSYCIFLMTSTCPEVGVALVNGCGTSGVGVFCGCGLAVTEFGFEKLATMVSLPSYR